MEKLNDLSERDREALIDFMGLSDCGRDRTGHLMERLHASMLLHRRARAEKIN
ncbi:hypothetical protein [Aliiroseovarius sp.]|uniref:hypothetical protein n=1 Tax=Aliiroseovarius sp. TaxID=1872442 RepID=UPI003BAA3F6D